MNWYKKAEAATVSVTPEEFGAMDWDEKRALAENRGITPATQLLFFTEEYEDKDVALWDLAGNPNLTPEVQRLFITQEYWGKHWALRALTDNPSIHPEVQPLFFTQKYDNKDEVLRALASNHSFLRDFTLKQLLQIKKVARGGMRLLVLSKRLEQIAGVS